MVNFTPDPNSNGLFVGQPTSAAAPASTATGSSGLLGATSPQLPSTSSFAAALEQKREPPRTAPTATAAPLCMGSVAASSSAVRTMDIVLPVAPPSPRSSHDAPAHRSRPGPIARTMLVAQQAIPRPPSPGPPPNAAEWFLGIAGKGALPASTAATSAGTGSKQKRDLPMPAAPMSSPTHERPRAASRFEPFEETVSAPQRMRRRSEGSLSVEPSAAIKPEMSSLTITNGFTNQITASQEPMSQDDMMDRPTSPSRPPSRENANRPSSREITHRPPSREITSRPRSREIASRPSSREFSHRPPSRELGSRPSSRGGMSSRGSTKPARPSQLVIRTGTLIDTPLNRSLGRARSEARSVLVHQPGASSALGHSSRAYEQAAAARSTERSHAAAFPKPPAGLRPPDDPLMAPGAASRMVANLMTGLDVAVASDDKKKPHSILDEAVSQQREPFDRLNLTLGQSPQRRKWKQQLEREQTLQADPNRVPVFPLSIRTNTELESPWHAAQLEALAYQGAPLRFNGSPIRLPGPSSLVSAVRATATRPREDASRWPPTHEASAKTILATTADGFAPCASMASKMASFAPPPSTPAGQFAQANASFLGSEVLRCLTPRPNVQKPPTTAHDLRRQQQQRGGPFLESVAVEDSMPVSLYSSAFRLDEFMGGGVIAPPLTGQAVPTFDPRTTGPIAGQRLNSPRRASPPPRTASPRVSAKRHTAEFYKSLF